MSEHTPGPWVVDPIPEDDNSILITTDRPNRDDVEIVGSAVDCQERYHNARLIAAAPEMLEALEQVLASGLIPCNCHQQCEGSCTNATVRNAIASATKE